MPLVLAHVGLLVTWDLAARPLATLVCLGLGAGALAYAGWRLGRIGAPGAATILLVAVVLRLLLLPVPPTLSEDVLRYLWDGKIAGAGLNPYLLEPDAPELEPLRDADWQRLPHRHIPTVYPPLAMAAFSIAARLPVSRLALKTLLTAADLATCVLLLWLARRRDLPRRRVVWYAWNPLVSLEVAGMGHVDALGVTAIVATVCLLTMRPRRVAAAASTAAAAVLVKLVPMVALPAFARQSGQARLFLGLSVALVAIACLPVAVAGGGVPPGLVTYGVSWEFNGPLWEPLWRLLDRIEVSVAVERALDAIKQRTGEHDFWNRFYPFNYPELLAKLLLAPGLVAVVVLAWQRTDPLVSAGILFGGLPLFSATVYPWYLLWVLPWAALCRQPAWLVLAALAPLSYLPQVTDLPLMPWVFLAHWLPFAAVLAARPRWSTA
ncbi:MAG: hypothetical protein ACE5EG_01960 [Thermoanaerobaculia bacterium]